VENGTDPLVAEGGEDTGLEDEGDEGDDSTIDTDVEDTGLTGDDGDDISNVDSGGDGGTTGSAFTDKDDRACNCSSGTRRSGGTAWLTALVLALSLGRRRRRAA
jgi:MYXO-CTERM domain-containing protein